MYMIAEGKVYSMQFNTALNIYPEIKLTKNAAGAILFAPQATGVKSKPLGRQIATTEEVIAQFGGAARAASSGQPAPKAPAVKKPAASTK